MRRAASLALDLPSSAVLRLVLLNLHLTFALSFLMSQIRKKDSELDPGEVAHSINALRSSLSSICTKEVKPRGMNLLRWTPTTQEVSVLLAASLGEQVVFQFHGTAEEEEHDATHDDPIVDQSSSSVKKIG